MYFRILGNEVEHQQAAKRLEQISNAKPDTLEGQEYKELLAAFLKFEKEIQLNLLSLSFKTKIVV